MEAIIFDMDGVLVDTVHLYYKANLHAANALGVSFTEEDNQRLQGINRFDTVRAIAGRPIRDELVAQLAAEKTAIYKQLITTIDKSAILPGVRDFLAVANVPLAVASSSENAELVLTKTGLRPFFDYVVDVKTIQRGKPDPEIFLTAAQALGVAPEKCVAIEDGIAGFTGIRATPMFAVAIGTEDWCKAADWHITSTAELNWEMLNAVYARRFK